MKISLKATKVRIESDIFLGGSVIKGTVFSGFSEVRSHFELESDAPREELLRLVKIAKKGCFAESMVQTAVPVKSSYSLNGENVQIKLEN